MASPPLCVTIGTGNVPPSSSLCSPHWNSLKSLVLSLPHPHSSGSLKHAQRPYSPPTQTFNGSLPPHRKAAEFTGQLPLHANPVPPGREIHPTPLSYYCLWLSSPPLFFYLYRLLGLWQGLTTGPSLLHSHSPRVRPYRALKVLI